MPWRPSLGAWPDRDGTRFRVWAPTCQTVELVFEDAVVGPQPLGKDNDGYWDAWVAEARPGMRYRYLLDGRGPYPDPASRFQPLGVHGPSEIVDPTAFRWTDDGWRGVPLEKLVVYELHLGTFTADGTYAAAIHKLGAPLQSIDTGIVCETCGSPMRVKKSFRGPFLGCSAYPKCRSTKLIPAELKEKLKDVLASPPKKPELPHIDTGIVCEKCGNLMHVKNGLRGPFLGCSAYPKCRSTMLIPAELKEKLKDVLPSPPKKPELPHLVELGVTAIELMPLADFPGERGWSYDGVDLFAPARCYGRPDDLRRLIDAAHRRGIAVLLDVVYNHLGPDGNYLGHFSPYYFGTGTEWGEGPNFAGEHHEHVRHFFIENALYWLNEYHFDGLRLDATHVISDGGPRPFVAELTERVKAETPRPVLLFAEDFRNLDTLLKPAGEGGWGLDGVWADDFHHEVRRFLCGDHEGHYRDYTGTVADLATTMNQGWFYTGQWSAHGQRKRGTDPAGIPHQRFVWCIQNHDQVGNRALGERLNHQIDLAAYRAATALLLASPATPLLWMGQEWAATSPFLFFTDHHAELGRLVTEGRRKEFGHFEAFHDAGAAARIPDPQAKATFLASKLKWAELQQPEHAATLRYYQALLRLRQDWGGADDAFHVRALDNETLAMVRVRGRRAWTTVVRLRGSGEVELDAELLPEGRRHTVLTSEDASFCIDPRQPAIDLDAPAITFQRPGAVLVQVDRL
jgi:maltooligosyltrehalose trehalohydrolase